MRPVLVLAVFLLAEGGCKPPTSQPARVGWDPSEAKFEGKSVSGLLGQLATGTSVERRDAAAHLMFVYHGLDHPIMQSGRMGWEIAENEGCRRRAEVLIPHLIAAIGDPDPSVRLAVVTTINVMSFHAKAARDALETRLTDSDGGVRVAAKEALKCIPE